jgi:hypothetical protein
MLIKLNDAEKAEFLGVAQRGVQRCRDAMQKLRFSDPQHEREMRQQLEATAKIWEGFASSTLPDIESPKTCPTEPELLEGGSPKLSEPLSEIEIVIGEK